MRRIKVKYIKAEMHFREEKLAFWSYHFIETIFTTYYRNIIIGFVRICVPPKEMCLSD